MLPSIDLYSPSETAEGFLELRFDAGDSDTDVVAPYGIYQFKYRDRFQVLAGARLDMVDFDDSVSGDSRDDSDVSPMLGLVYSPAENLSLFANARAANRAATVRSTSGFGMLFSRSAEVD